MSSGFMVGAWCWHGRQSSPCRVVDRQEIWGEVVYRVWLPAKDAVVRARAAELSALDTFEPSVDRILHTAAAAKLLDALQDNLLLAPIQSSVVPLPHQLYALNRVMSQHRIRYLLADEVGLGKTIEAGLILRELKLRGMARRILVVAPKGLIRQWQAEMRLHFNEKLQYIDPAELAAFRQWRNDEENLWRLHDQVICSLDSVKPIDGRKGWSLEQLNNYNRERFEDLISASWDLVRSSRSGAFSSVNCRSSLWCRPRSHAAAPASAACATGTALGAVVDPCGSRCDGIGRHLDVGDHAVDAVSAGRQDRASSRRTKSHEERRYGHALDPTVQHRPAQRDGRCGAGQGDCRRVRHGKRSDPRRLAGPAGARPGRRNLAAHANRFDLRLAQGRPFARVSAPRRQGATGCRADAGEGQDVTTGMPELAVETSRRAGPGVSGSRPRTGDARPGSSPSPRPRFRRAPRSRYLRRG